MAGRPITRRDALLAMGGMLAVPGIATAQASAAWERLPAIARLLADGPPRLDGLVLDLPALTEDGSAVSLTVVAESPMSADDHIVAMHLFATRNPSPELAVLHLTPAVGRAELSTRVRLNESQTVVAIARTSRGETLATARDVTVTTTGCLVPGDVDATTALVDPRVRVTPGDPAEVRTLISHPMETGLRLDAAGRPAPERIVREVTVSVGDALLLRAELFRAIAANPYLRFFVGTQPPAELRVTWTEDGGASVSAVAELAAA